MEWLERRGTHIKRNIKKVSKADVIEVGELDEKEMRRVK